MIPQKTTYKTTHKIIQNKKKDRDLTAEFPREW
jgi:hypothetical protein